MSRVTTPTPGRIVWFYPVSANPGFAGNLGDPRAAIVVDVQDDRSVNLLVFDANGSMHPRGNVPLMQPDDETPAGDYCGWMPYQVNQAFPLRAEPVPAPAVVPSDAVKSTEQQNAAASTASSDAPASVGDGGAKANPPDAPTGESPVSGVIEGGESRGDSTGS